MVFVNRQKFGVEMELAGRPVCGGGDVLVGAYRRTLKTEAQQRNQGGNGGEIHWNRVNLTYI